MSVQHDRAGAAEAPDGADSATMNNNGNHRLSSENQKKSADDLKHFGIISHEQTTYEWNGYRYSNSADALAAAKRAAR
jgi:hypothetical protein